MNPYHDLLATAEELLQMGVTQQAIQIGQQLVKNPDYRPQGLKILGKGYAQIGNYGAAIDVLQQLQQQGYRDAEILFWLGSAYLHQNQLITAIEVFQQMAENYPQDPRGWIYWGATLLEVHQVSEAINVLEKGNSFHPGNAILQAYLGGAYYQQKQFQAAYILLRQVVQGKENVLGDWPIVLLANTCKALHRFTEAVLYFKKALEVNPNNVSVLNTLATLLVEMQQAEQALPVFQKLLTLDKHNPVFWFNYGNAFRMLGRLPEAINCYRTALQEDEQFPEAHYNLAKVLTDMGSLAPAELHFRQVIRIKPEIKEAWINLVYVLQETGQVAAALKFTEKALERFPENRVLRWNRCILLLLQGEYRKAWPDYELRLEMGQTQLYSYPVPRWKGDSISGKRLIIHNDQGLGDAIQFFRFINQIRSRVGHIILAVPRALVRLFAYQHIVEEVIEEGKEYPKADYEIPIGSLPGLLNITLDELQYAHPYLKVNKKWQEALPQLESFPDRLKVGIVWRGNPKHTRDLDRSVSLETLAPLAELPHIQLYSLQKGEGAQEISRVSFRSRIIPVGNYFKDFADTAAFIQQLDLVISVDTAVAHLSAALGKPTWILLQFAPDWRWLLHREDSPWYPTVRLFRQKEWRNWNTVIQSVVEALQQQNQNYKAHSKPSFTA